MEEEFNSLVKQNLYEARKLYHGTTADNAKSIEDNGINLNNCKVKTDFNGNGGFYLTADIHQAIEWAESKANGKNCKRVVLRFKIDRKVLEQRFNYKRFNVGEYQDWVKFIRLSRSGQHHHNYDIVEGPYGLKNASGKYSKPHAHQLGLFSDDVVKYFDDHIISMSCPLPRLLEELTFD